MVSDFLFYLCFLYKCVSPCVCVYVCFLIIVVLFCFYLFTKEGVLFTGTRTSGRSWKGKTMIEIHYLKDTFNIQ